MDKKIFTVYMHIAPNMKKYIGITCRKPEKRWDSGEGYKTQNFYRAISKYGWNSFQHIIIAEKLTKKEACKLEIDMIKYWNTANPKDGYNIYVGGELGAYGIPLTEETKEKLRQANLGRTMSEEHKKIISKTHSGKVVSEETREKLRIARLRYKVSNETRKKMSESAKGKIHTKETREKLRQANLGHSVSEKTREKLRLANLGHLTSEETRKKLSKANKGQKRSKEFGDKVAERNRGKKYSRETIIKMSKPILQYDLEMNFIQEWAGATTASKAIGCNNVGICMCCTGRSKTSGGFIWRHKSTN